MNALIQAEAEARKRYDSTGKSAEVVAAKIKLPDNLTNGAIAGQFAELTVSAKKTANGWHRMTYRLRGGVISPTAADLIFTLHSNQTAQTGARRLDPAAEGSASAKDR